ncbi:MAG: host attachment protein, partial [Pseudomonadota bacterium]|nr:host attachment protein [Pseudomonadota bacterium]
MQMDHDAVVLVADGRKLLFFRNKGDATYPNLEAEAVKQQDNPAHLDQASDKAGQSS